MDWKGLEAKIKAELGRASVDSKHPWRYPALATIHQGGPDQRTVVLRKFDPKTWLLLMYTDIRSQKILDIQANNQVSLLFYHPRKQWQLRLKGSITLNHQNERSKAIRANLAQQALSDYQSIIAPGEKLGEEPQSTEADLDHFCVLDFQLKSLDYLELNRAGHRRFKAVINSSGLDWTEVQA